MLEEDGPDVADLIQLNMEKKQVAAFMNVLDEREKEVIVFRFGLENEKERTQREIAKELGISRSYVSRIEKRALLKLFQEFYKQQKYGSSGKENRINFMN
ncbi:RNA polymerase sporulation-specific sigma factor [Salibacterium halotolerans]|uniref:RNA polymerase sporulation-specific sigma factor n=1 Tax=Salibacterium halotolerans TaxID=1884432 RepID=A0A1I5NCQ5_9BACI|nr:RNA polymerase sporulation-specific sigma factor [Salibacterium halotolerans]